MKWSHQIAQLWDIVYKFVAISQKYWEWPSLAYHNRIKKKVRSKWTGSQEAGQDGTASFRLCDEKRFTIIYCHLYKVINVSLPWWKTSKTFTCGLHKNVGVFSYHTLNPLKSQHHLSPNNINKEWREEVMRIDKQITTGEMFRSHQILSTDSLRKCMETSLENLLVEIWGLKGWRQLTFNWIERSNWIHFHCIHYKHTRSEQWGYKNHSSFSTQIKNNLQSTK